MNLFTHIFEVAGDKKESIAQKWSKLNDKRNERLLKESTTLRSQDNTNDTISSMNEFEGGEEDYPSDSENGDNELDSNLDEELYHA